MKGLAALVCFALAGLLPAQVRQPLVGQVLRANGKPLPGATVTLVEDHVDIAGIDPVDVLQVTTDRRGRFVASALRGVRYGAFAVGPVIDGVSLVAPPVADLACGRQAELVASVTGAARQVRLTDIDKWGKPTEFHVRLRWKHCQGHFVELPIDKDGQITVPASAVVGEADLYDQAGHQVGGAFISSSGKAEARVWDPGWVNILVVDEEGAPVAGAEVAIEFDDRGGDFMTVANYEYFRGDTAVTDAKGTARLRCEKWQNPLSHVHEQFLVVARKPGFYEGGSGRVCKEPFVGWEAKEFSAGKQKQLRIPLKPLPKATAEPELASVAFRGKRARLFAMGIVRKTEDAMVMSYFLPRSYDVEIAASGALTVPPLAPLATSLIMQLPPVDGRKVIMRPTRAPQLPSADLADCDLLSLQLLDVSGGPASDASVMLVSHKAQSLTFRHIVPLVPDQSGRLEVWLQRGAWTLLAMDETTWVTKELSEWSGDEPMQLQLEPKLSRRVRVLDAGGAPVAGAKFEPGAFQPGFPVGPGLPQVLSNLGWNSLAAHLRQATTDAKGEATLHFLPYPNTQPTAFAFRVSHKNRTEDLAILEGDKPLVFQLQ